MAGTLGSIFVRLGFKVDAQAIDRVQTRLGALGEKAMGVGKQIGSLGRGMQRFGVAASAALALPVLGAAVAVGRMAGDFDSQMRVVQAVAGATAEELAQLREKAIQLGGDTQYSASQAAQAMIEFSKAGLSANQVLAAIGPSLNFAAASGLELGRVAEITANSMAQFGLDASEAGYISDVFTRAADASTTGVEELSQAMSEAAPFARLVGADIKETMTILGAFANAGIQGSKAGTALKNGFVALSAPTPKAVAALESMGIAVSDFMDASGNFKVPFTDVLKRLSQAGVSIEKGVAIFGRESAGAMLSVINDFVKVEKVAESMAGLQGNAATQAAIKMAGFNGALAGFKSALETLAIRIGEAGILDFMESVIKAATHWIKAFSNLNPQILKWGSIILGVAAGMSVVVAALGTVIVALNAVGLAGLKMWLGLLGPIALVAAGIALVVAVVILFIDDLFAFLEGRPSLIGAMIDKLWETFPNLMRGLATTWRQTKEGFSQMWDSVKETATAFWDGIVSGTQWGVEKIASLFDWLGSKLNSFLDMWDKVTSPVSNFFSDAGANLDEAIRARTTPGGRSSAPQALAGGRGPAPGMPKPLLLSPEAGAGISALASPKLTSGLSTGLSEARNISRSSVSQSANQTINAPINISIQNAPGSNANPQDIARAVQKELTAVTQSAAQGARPVFAQ